MLRLLPVDRRALLRAMFVVPKALAQGIHQVHDIVRLTGRWRAALSSSPIGLQA
jgi:hypothetical protein